MQVLLYLAWAATVHKSQGFSMSKVQIDWVKKEFCFGSTFVELSRVKDLGGLMILDSSDYMSKILFLMSAKQTLLVDIILHNDTFSISLLFMHAVGMLQTLKTSIKH
ncbi:hypothetical protein K435DRAFT_43635 [Dendrothele bispora CBS 962.96]|uniref:UvrD-like helicase C-terminal domain-containing protein n=1 Tax=Dendrothele bispora (strain CBS 962.96) TaxID=1314807 RepID=A0A4S8MSC8_DENBC|nr:hypothetical protein K435DRAFT_43635 [Dendrothele bispora CBS 962.96]